MAGGRGTCDGASSSRCLAVQPHGHWRRARKTIPIVFNIGTDPVKDGLVESFNRPGGNVTGVSYLSAELEPKRLQILHELIPHAGVIAVLSNPTLHDTAAVVKDLEAAAGVIGQELVVLKASSQADFDAAFANMTEKRIGALLVAADPFLTANRDQLVVRPCRRRASKKRYKLAPPQMIQRVRLLR